MRVLSLLFLVAIAGCSSVTDGNADDCGVSSDEFDKAVEEVSEFEPYTGRTLGTCELIVNDAEFVHVITPETREGVERMIAEERAKAEQ